MVVFLPSLIPAGQLLPWATLTHPQGTPVPGTVPARTLLPQGRTDQHLPPVKAGCVPVGRPAQGQGSLGWVQDVTSYLGVKSPGKRVRN